MYSCNCLLQHVLRSRSSKSPIINFYLKNIYLLVLIHLYFLECNWYISIRLFIWKLIDYIANLKCELAYWLLIRVINQCEQNVSHDTPDSFWYYRRCTNRWNIYSGWSSWLWGSARLWRSRKACFVKEDSMLEMR